MNPYLIAMGVLWTAFSLGQGAAMGFIMVDIDPIRGAVKGAVLGVAVGWSLAGLILSMTWLSEMATQ